ncbi:hypothetical protein ACMYSQ_002715 [Aspergillus niger]
MRDDDELEEETRSGKRRMARGSCGGRGSQLGGGLYTRDRQILRDGEQLDSQSRNNSRCDGEDDLFSHWHHWMTMMRLLCLPDLLNLTATCPDPSLNSQTRWISSISAPRLTDQPIRGPLLMDQQAAAHPLV